MRRLLRDRRGAFGFLVLLVIVVCAIAAPLVTNGEPTAQRDIVATRFLPPLSQDLQGAFHPIGTDRFGRDVWTRLIYGARVSMGVGVLAVLVSVVLGMIVGAVAGYWRGPISVALLALTGFALALPRVVLLLWLPAGSDTLGNAPWVAIAPGVALVLVVVACTLLGDALRDVLDPHVRR